MVRDSTDGTKTVARPDFEGRASITCTDECVTLFANQTMCHNVQNSEQTFFIVHQRIFEISYVD